MLLLHQRLNHLPHQSIRKTRINTTHNRTMDMTCSYTAIGTSDELMPGEFDDDNDDDNEDMNSGIELMMTTV